MRKLVLASVVLLVVAAFAVFGESFAQSGACGAGKSVKSLESEETSIADSLPVPAPEPSEGEEIMDEEVVDEDA